MLKFTRPISLLFVLFALTTASVSAQTGTSSITGRVVDSKDAILPGATVTVTNEATGLSQAQTTTDSGAYTFASLPVGSYTVTVEQTGFKKFHKTHNALAVGTPLAVDAVLEVGQVSEVVTVQGGAEQLQSSNATIGNVVEQKSIEALPLNGRNPLTLLLFEPGVVQRSQGAAGSGVHVNGSRDRAFNVTIDGIDANESSVPNPVSNLYRINPDNIQEYKVTTNNATAEEGRNSGASVSVATRSGTNDLHGTVFYFMRNEALNSKEFFANARGLAKSLIRLHQYGVEVGGPIKKNKTFFFGSYQGSRINLTQPIDQSFGTPIIYTPSAFSGIYRYVKGTVNGLTANSPALVDSKTGAYVAGVRNCTSLSDTNCIASFNIFANDPLGRGLNPVVASIMGKYPQPNSYAFGDGFNTAAFIWNAPSQFQGPAIMARIDHTFNDSNSIFGRWLQSTFDTTQGDLLNSRPQVFPGFPPLGEVFRKTQNLALSYRRVISPRIVNEFTAGFSRFDFFFTFAESNPDYPNIPPFNFTNTSEPYLNIPRTRRVITTPQVLDNLSIVSGAHVYRLGGNFRFYRHVDQRGLPGGSSLAPEVTFAGSRAPASFGSAASLGMNSTDFGRFQGAIVDLLGIPGNISQNFLGNISQDVFLPFKVGDKVTLHGVKTNLNQLNFYGQDEWKFRPNLTLNYGVRWEINLAPSTVRGNTFVPSTPIAGTPLPAIPVAGQPGAVTFVKANSWFKRNNIGAIAPSLGLAWSPDFKNGFFHTLFGGNNKSVVRLGYRMAFDTISSFQATAVAGKVPGLITLCSSTVGGATTPFCAAEPDVRIDNPNFLTQLPPPTRKPSEFLTPFQQFLNNSPSLIMFDPNLKIPTVHQWSLSVQRELPGAIVAQVAYIGRRGTRLFRAYDINEIEADPILPSFLIMQQNVAITGCRPSGTTAAGVTCGSTPPLLTQLQTQGGLTATAAASFLNNSTTLANLTQNAAGTFAGRIESSGSSSGNTLGLKLRSNQQFGVITYLDSGGDSYYHAAQFTLRRRFTSGLGSTLSYTWGKSIDDQSVDPVGAASGGGLSTTNSRTPITIRDWRQERARSDFDRTHVLTSTWVWELPVGRGKRFLTSSRGVVNHLLGGWTINGIFTFMSGEPFSVSSGVRTANNSHNSRAAVLDPTVRPRLQNIPNVIGPVLFANNSAFALPAPGSNGAGRNIFQAPHYWNLDLGFIKMFQITERVKLQFRTEMFNALNHPNFDNPRDASVGSPTFTSPVFAQTCCVTVAPVNAQAVVPTGESARIIQFALKLQF